MVYNQKLRPSAREFQKINNKSKILECGVWIGDNAINLYTELKPQLLFLIDRWYESYEHYNFPQIKTFPQKVFDKFYDKYNVIIIRSDTLFASQFFKDEYFDYIYLDDNHSFEHVVNELQLYYSKLKKGGIFSGDNYEMAGVKKAVDDFIKNNNLELNTEAWKKSPTGTGATDWWTIKK